MKLRFFIVFITVLGVTTNFVTAQNRIKENLLDGRSFVMLTPQYLAVKQFRVELDRKLIGRHWISFAPHYIQDIQQFQEHQGFGLAATYKYFLKNTNSYFGGGLQFTHHTHNHYALDQEGNTDMWMFRSTVTQYGINAVSGHYFRIYPFLFGDIYYGVGYRLANTKTSDGLFHDYNNSFFDSNYKGFMLVVGFRIGVML